jgi:serine protease AprX
LEQAKSSTQAADAQPPPAPHRTLRAVFKVWESAEMRPLTRISVRTVKADAAQTAYAATGKGIVWAVLDSGIDKTHPHFADYGNVLNEAPLIPKSFLAATDPVSADPLQDPFGHGTHCAGIIAGCAKANAAATSAEQAVSAEGTTGEYHLKDVAGIHGMAPQCKLLSLKILSANGTGDVTAAINALEYVMQLNSYGAHILVHGVNLSTGYLPDPQYYGTGSTPLCRQVDRAVRSGICVVVAAGNTGYVETEYVQDGAVAGYFQAAQLSSINDPGNAKLAITVGSTHREEPHTYGVSYFSSKGPTADGRQKPDVVAPGERIVSCAAGKSKTDVASALTQAGAPGTFDYIEDSGTSMAAPHVSGIIAAFLSIRREFIGESEAVRKLVRRSAMDLRRDRRVQGAGLVDLMRLIESV